MTLDSRLSRSGITLVELLITILIISILAGLILGVASVAGETAREAHTRNVVTRLHTLLMEHYGTYKTRRVKVQDDVIDSINGNPSLSSSQKGRLLAEARLYALRELILMEVPDRWSDILLDDVPQPSVVLFTPKPPIYLDVTGSPDGRTQLASIYLRRYRHLAQRIQTADDVERLTDNQGAECLYMIITLATGDGEARSLFGERDIGDTDGDGAPEFLDGWGRPINFLRWAPGFDSQIQLDTIELATMTTSEQSAAIANDHDPFDLFRIETAAFRLVPLIFSAGSDESFGIRLVKPHVTWVPDATPPAGAMPGGFPRMSPYYKVRDDDGDVYLGTPSEGAADNIHNHLLGLR